MSHNEARDDGDILGLSSTNAPKAKKPRDDGDILGLGTQEDQADQDALVDEQSPVTDGIFGGLATECMTEEQLEGLVGLMSMSIDLRTVKAGMSEAGCPRMGKGSVIPKMVSEACKIYIAQLIELSVEERKDFVTGDAVSAKRYNL